jgi:hypothetical protein
MKWLAGLLYAFAAVSALVASCSGTAPPSNAAHRGAIAVSRPLGKAPATTERSELHRLIAVECLFAHVQMERGGRLQCVATQVERVASNQARPDR